MTAWWTCLEVCNENVCDGLCRSRISKNKFLDTLVLFVMDGKEYCVFDDLSSRKGR